MTRKMTIITLLASALALSATMSGVVRAQTAEVSAAKAAGLVGEQADGYLGFKGVPGGELKAAVDTINIKRRDAYTQTAAARGVTVKEAAAAVGCQTLASRVSDGQIYRLPDGVWRVKAGPVPLPAYCAQ